MNKDEMRAEIKRIEKLNAPGIALHLKYKKFWDDNHPKPGAKPSKEGMEAQLCDVGDWCYCGRWLRLLFQNAANHCSYFLSLQRKAPVVFTWDTIVYPIAEPVER